MSFTKNLLKEIASSQGDSDIVKKSLFIGLTTGLISSAAYYLFAKSSES
jgi:hypothetical protein